MVDPTRRELPETQSVAIGPDARRWVGPAALATLVLVPVAILIFSNLESTEVSWAGFRFNQPLWAILLVTFAAGMVGGKVAGWGWRRWRKRRKRLKDELEVLRKHSADTDPSR